MVDYAKSGIFASSEEKMKHIVKFSILLLMGLITIPASGQDLMARQANMDKQLKAVDSVSLLKTYQKEISAMVSNLYTTWTHDNVDAYRDVPKPAYFKVDLRDFTMPTPSRNVTSNYGYRRRFRSQHKGIDVKVYTGDTIVSAFSGKVRMVAFDRKGFGYYVVIRHPNGLETVYGHLSKQLVREDEMVKSGQPIGLGGNTGHSFGSHLHFETRILGEAIDPALMFDFARQDIINDYFVYTNESAAMLAANQKSASNSVVASNASGEKADGATSSSLAFHKVKKGDTLYSIALQCGMTVEALCKLNRLSKRSKLRIGQIIKCK